MAFVNISTTAGESPYGVATASGAVHSIIATTRDARSSCSLLSVYKPQYPEM